MTASQGFSSDVRESRYAESEFALKTSFDSVSNYDGEGGEDGQYDHSVDESGEDSSSFDVLERRSEDDGRELPAISGKSFARSMSSSLERGRSGSIVSSKGSVLYVAEHYPTRHLEEVGTPIRFEQEEREELHPHSFATRYASSSPHLRLEPPRISIDSTGSIAASTCSSGSHWKTNLDAVVQSMGDENENGTSQGLESTEKVRRMKSILGPKVRMVSRAPWDGGTDDEDEEEHQQEDAAIDTVRRLPPRTSWSDIPSTTMMRNALSAKEKEKQKAGSGTFGSRVKILSRLTSKTLSIVKDNPDALEPIKISSPGPPVLGSKSQARYPASSTASPSPTFKSFPFLAPSTSSTPPHHDLQLPTPPTSERKQFISRSPPLPSTTFAISGAMQLSRSADSQLMSSEAGSTPSPSSLTITTLAGVPRSGSMQSTFSIPIADEAPTSYGGKKLVLISLDEARKRDFERVAAAAKASAAASVVAAAAAILARKVEMASIAEPVALSPPTTTRKPLSIAVDRANTKEEQYSTFSSNPKTSPSSKSLATKRSGFFKRMMDRNTIFSSSAEEQRKYQVLSADTSRPLPPPFSFTAPPEHNTTKSDQSSHLRLNKSTDRASKGLTAPTPLSLRPISMGFSGLPVHFLDAQSTQTTPSISPPALSPTLSPGSPSFPFSRPVTPKTPSSSWDHSPSLSSSTNDSRTPPFSPVQSSLDSRSDDDRAHSSIRTVQYAASDATTTHLREQHDRTQLVWTNQQVEYESQIKELRGELDKYVATRNRQSDKTSCDACGQTLPVDVPLSVEFATAFGMTAPVPIVGDHSGMARGRHVGHGSTGNRFGSS